MENVFIMDKVYIQLRELVEQCGASLSELMELANNGKLAVYFYSKKKFEYFLIPDFNNRFGLYTTSEIERETKRLEHEKIKQLQFIDNEVSKAEEGINKYRCELGGIAGIHCYLDEVRRIGKGRKEIIINQYEQKINDVKNIEITKKRLFRDFFIKYSDYEDIYHKPQTTSKGGRKKDTVRIKETNDACDNVEKLYFSEKTKEQPLGKNNLKEYATWELNKTNKSKILKKLHTETFQKRYSEWVKQGYARGQGNPHEG